MLESDLERVSCVSDEPTLCFVFNLEPEMVKMFVFPALNLSSEEPVAVRRTYQTLCWL